MYCTLALLTVLLIPLLPVSCDPPQRLATTVVASPSSPPPPPPPPPASSPTSPPAPGPPGPPAKGPTSAPVLPPAPPPSGSVPPPGPSAPFPSGSVPALGPNGTLTGNVSFTSAPTFPITLPSINPTAIPLSVIVPTQAALPTVPLDSTYAAGATPTLIPGAPPLPDISAINPANYPPLDKPPPTDSQQVQQWISEVASSGFSIPDIAPSKIGGCPMNPDRVANSSICWWSCSQCTRSTDIITCPDKFTWGSSFDDGPSPSSPHLIQYLDQQNLKTTFFVVGSRVISRPDHLRTQYMGGHQISVHTWSHTPLTTQTNEQIIAELGWSKKVIKDVLGVTPNTFRPPFGDVDDRVRAIAAAMGLTTIIWTSGAASNHVSFDTNDFVIGNGQVSASGVIRNFQAILGNASVISSGFIVLEHDLFQQAVEVATGYILPTAIAMNFTIKPIVNCLNKPLSDAYIETNDNKTNPAPSAVGTSIVGGAATLSAGAPGSTGATKNGVAAVGVGHWTLSALLFGAAGSIVAL